MFSSPRINSDPKWLLFASVLWPIKNTNQLVFNITCKLEPVLMLQWLALLYALVIRQIKHHQNAESVNWSQFVACTVYLFVLKMSTNSLSLQNLLFCLFVFFSLCLMLYCVDDISIGAAVAANQHERIHRHEAMAVCSLVSFTNVYVCVWCLWSSVATQLMMTSHYIRNGRKRH